MQVLAIAALLVAILSFQYWYGLSTHQREWVGTHGGQRLRLVVSRDRFVLEVDGQQALETTLAHRMRPVVLSGGLRFRQHFLYDIREPCQALGGSEVRIASESWMYGDQGELVMMIGGRRIPLLSVDPKLDGSAEAALASLEHGADPISDPRFQNAQQILGQVRTAMGEDPTVLQATQQLSQQLQMRFAMLAELNGPEAEQIWADQPQRTQLIEALEAELLSCLSAVEHFHQLSIRHRQAALGEADLGEISEVLEQLQARDEVAQASEDARRALLQRMASKTTQRG